MLHDIPGLSLCFHVGCYLCSYAHIMSNLFQATSLWKHLSVPMECLLYQVLKLIFLFLFSSDHCLDHSWNSGEIVYLMCVLIQWHANAVTFLFTTFELIITIVDTLERTYVHIFVFYLIVRLFLLAGSGDGSVYAWSVKSGKEVK